MTVVKLECVDSIDLYADGDDVDQEFNSVVELNGGQVIDLYEEALISSSDCNNDATVGSGDGDNNTHGASVSSATITSGGTNSSGCGMTPMESNEAVANESTSANAASSSDRKEGMFPSRKYQAFIGNLTWWTTDVNIQDNLRDIGVNDFKEIRFYENRANGQSKGFCIVTVGSESSLKLIHERLPKKEIHGRDPTVSPPTKQALMQLEANSKTRPPQGQGNQGNMNMGPGPRNELTPPEFGGNAYGNHGHGFHPRMPMGGGGPGGPMRPRGPPLMGMSPNRHPFQGPGLLGRPPMHASPPPRLSAPRPPMGGMNRMPPPPPNGPGPGGMHPPMNNDMGMRGPPPREWSRHHNHKHKNDNQNRMSPYPPHRPGSVPMPPHVVGPVPMPGPRGGFPPQVMGHGPGEAPPVPHMNPAFFRPAQPQSNHPPPPGYETSPQLPSMQAHVRFRPSNNATEEYDPESHHISSHHKMGDGNRDRAGRIKILTDAEFEDVMSRNRTVSSSAITRAVADASVGEIDSAIETLLTAISLIRQSRVSHDDRCQILITSLQDTLDGIEGKAKAKGLKFRRDRDRSRSRDRDREHERRRRPRSRSRERYYRDRERERELMHRERERSRERYERVRSRSPDSRYDRFYDRYRERDREHDRERGERRRSDPERRSRERDSDRERDHPDKSDIHRSSRH